MYPAYNQDNPDDPNCREESAYPAAPDSEYGWEKLFSERLYLAYSRNHALKVRIGRYHNIFGVEGTWRGGREKAPAAICRKIAMEPEGGTIDIWGPGTQTRSFLYIDECVEGTLRLMRSDFTGPVNIGSDEKISINDLAQLVMKVSGKTLTIKNIDGPIGVNGRNSDNTLIKSKLAWAPSQPLEAGIRETYRWISDQVRLNSVVGASRVLRGSEISSSDKSIGPSPDIFGSTVAPSASFLDKQEELILTLPEKVEKLPKYYKFEKKK